MPSQTFEVISCDRLPKDFSKWLQRHKPRKDRRRTTKTSSLPGSVVGDRLDFRNRFRYIAAQAHPVLLLRILLGVLAADGLGAGFHFFGLRVPFHLPQQNGVVP